MAGVQTDINDDFKKQLARMRSASLPAPPSVPSQPRQPSADVGQVFKQQLNQLRSSAEDNQAIYLSHAKPGPYKTQLEEKEESQFQQWVKENDIPWQDSERADYDMRGYWKALITGDPRAKRAPNKHFPDTWKTPYDKSFSNESMYALPSAPRWSGNKLIGENGKVLYDEDKQGPDGDQGDGPPPDSPQAYIEKYAPVYGVDPRLIQAIMGRESNGNRDAISPKGARGLMQLMPDTARQLGVDPDDPEDNIKGGTKYVADLLAHYNGDVRLALAAYHAGQGAVDKAHGIPNTTDGLTRTNDYVDQIMKRYEKLSASSPVSSSPSLAMTPTPEETEKPKPEKKSAPEMGRYRYTTMGGLTINREYNRSEFKDELNSLRSSGQDEYIKKKKYRFEPEPGMVPQKDADEVNPLIHPFNFIGFLNQVWSDAGSEIDTTLFDESKRNEEFRSYLVKQGNNPALPPEERKEYQVGLRAFDLSVSGQQKNVSETEKSVMPVGRSLVHDLFDWYNPMMMALRGFHGIGGAAGELTGKSGMLARRAFYVANTAVGGKFTYDQTQSAMEKFRQGDNAGGWAELGGAGATGFMTALGLAYARPKSHPVEVQQETIKRLDALHRTLREQPEFRRLQDLMKDGKVRPLNLPNMTPEEIKAVISDLTERVAARGGKGMTGPVEAEADTSHLPFTVTDRRGTEKDATGQPTIIDAPVLNAQEREFRRQEQRERETMELLARERQERERRALGNAQRYRDEVQEQLQKEREIEGRDKRRVAPAALIDLRERMEVMANQQMYVDAADMARSLLEKKPRGKALTATERDFLRLWQERKRVTRGVSGAEDAKVTKFGKQEAQQEAERVETEQKLVEASRRLNEKARNASSPDETEDLAGQADEAIRHAERIRTEVSQARAAREAAKQEKQEYQLGAPVAKVTGSATQVRLPDGRKLAAHYAIVPGENLVISHHPESFEWNDKYQPRKMQPRDYKTNRESQAGVIAGGNDFEHDSFHNTDNTGHNGPPVILSDGRVAGGNGRSMRFIRAFKTEQRDAIYADLVKKSGQFGIHPGEIPPAEDMPVLVRVLDDSPIDLQSLIELGQDLNRDETRGFSSAEQAVMSAERLSQDTLEWVSRRLDDMGEDASIRDLMRHQGLALFQKLVADGVISPTKRAEFVTSNGELTARAKDMFENAMLGKVINDADLIATMPKQIRDKLFRSLSPLAKIRAADSAWNFTDYLQEAVRHWKRIDAITDTLDAYGKDLSTSEQYMRFQNGKMIKEGIHPAVEALIRFLDEKPLKIKDSLFKYIDDYEGRQHSLMGFEPPNPRMAFNKNIAEQTGVEVKEGEWGTIKPVEKPTEAKAEAAPEPTAEDDFGELAEVPTDQLEADIEQLREIVPDESDPMLQGYLRELEKRKDRSPEATSKQAEPPQRSEESRATEAAFNTAKADVDLARALSTSGPLNEEKLRDILSQHPNYSAGKVGAVVSLMKSFSEKYLGMPFDQWLEKKIAKVNIGGPGPARVGELTEAEKTLFQRKSRKMDPLPGFEHTFEERKEARAEYEGEQLSKAILEKKGDISKKSGDIERHSPLFAGTDANPERNVFDPAPEEQRGLGPTPDEPKPQDTLFQSDHVHGAGLTSVEELGRGEKFWRVKKNGQLTYQGVSPDASLQDGEALIGVKGDGSMRVQNQRMGMSDASALDRVRPRIQQALTELKRSDPMYQANKGAVDFMEDGRAVIHLLENADVSTVMHEFAHIARRNLKPEDMAIVKDWLKIKDNVAWDVVSEEKFARAFEKYLYDGEAPVPALKAVFKRIRDWMVDVYQAVKGSPINVRFPDEVRQVFDRMVAGEDIRTKKELPDYIKENRGRWFTPDENMARQYSRGETILAVDVPEVVARQTDETRVHGRPEHILPDVWKNKAKTADGMGPVAPGMVRLFRGQSSDVPETKMASSRPAERKKLSNAIEDEARRIQAIQEAKGDLVTPEERLSATKIADGGEPLSESMTDARMRVFPDQEQAIQWAKTNKDKIRGVSLYTLQDGRGFAHFLPRDPKVLFQEVDPTEIERRIRLIDERMGKIIPEAERSRLGKMRQELLAQKAQKNLALSPTPGETQGRTIKLWTPEGEREITDGPRKADTERRASDAASELQDAGRVNPVSESAGRSGSAEQDQPAGRGVRGSDASGGAKRASGGPRKALRDVEPAKLDAPAHERGTELYTKEQWAERTKLLRLPENSPAPTVRIPASLRRMLIFPGQPEVVEYTLSGLKQHDATIIATTTGTGKCLARGTPVLMFDGSIKKVEEVEVGDLLMGPDSNPRRVLSLAHGWDEMYRVTPTKGDPYEVNEAHILSLQMTGGVYNGNKWSNKTVDIPITEYLVKSKTWKHCAKGYRVGVEFPRNPCPIDPYFMGLWLGDGTSSRTGITSTEDVVIDFVYQFAYSQGLTVNRTDYPGRCHEYIVTTGQVGGQPFNPVRAALKRLRVFNNKHIPTIYRCNDRNVRLEVLAGIIDTDGSLSDGGYDLVFESKDLARDLVYLSRSLGFAAYMKPCEKTCRTNNVRGTYYRVYISGDVSVIPVRVASKKAPVRRQKKDVLRVGITVKHIGRGEYFGFEIDRDRRFLLGDFTVTHNTYTGSAVLNQLHKPGMRTLVLTTSKDLIHDREKGWIAVARDFDVDVNELPPGVSFTEEPGAYITTYATAIGRQGIEDGNWDLVISDEIGEARKWYSSQRGAMMKSLSSNAKKVLYMSATPFHTALELGHMDKLGLWREQGFSAWGKQFGIYKDTEGNWAGGNAPKKLIKLREQLIERGQFINVDRNMEGFETSFAQVPLTQEQVRDIKNITEAFKLAEEYFKRIGKKSMIRAVKGNAVTYVKKYLERVRLPQAIELMKKLDKEGWKTILFSETKSERHEIFDFLQPVDEALGGRISELLPPLPDVPEELEKEFGENLANYSGPHSAFRSSEKEAFNGDSKKHIYVSYAAGGIGVSLHDTIGTKPRAVIYLGPPYSGVMFDQAIGRAWRYGTKSNVHAIFMTSNARPEIHLILEKVAPRMSSLRALVSGVDDQDKFVNTLRSMDSVREGQLAYELGNKVKVDADDFTETETTHALQSWKDVKIQSAETAKNKGMKFPEEPTGGPGVIKLFQRDNEPPDDLELPREYSARRDNEIQRSQFEVSESMQQLPAPTRTMLADDVSSQALAEMKEEGNGDPSATVQLRWDNARKYVATMWDGLEGSRVAKAAKVQDMYWFTNGRKVIRDVAAEAGASDVGVKIARMLPEYHVEWGNISGPWVKQYFDILKENDISTKRKVKFTDPKTGEEKEVNEHHNLVMAKQGKQPPANPRIARAVEQTTKLLNDVRARLAKENVAVEIYDQGSGQRRYVPFSEIMDDPTYWPRKFDPEYEIRTTDPESGNVEVTKLKDLLSGDLGEVKKQRIIKYMMKEHGMTLAQAEDFLEGRGRDVPLVGNVERAREYDLPFYRTDPGAMISYLEGAGEAAARTRVFGQQRQKLEREITQIPNVKARGRVREIMDSVLSKRPFEEETKAFVSLAADWSVLSKMTFSALKAVGHSVHAAMSSNTRSYLRGLVEGTTGWKEAHDHAVLSGAILEQYKTEMLREYGAKRKIASKFLDLVGFQGTYEFGRVVSDATARQYLTKYALPKLMKERSVEYYRRTLKDVYLLSDAAIDKAVERGGWTDEDLNRAGKALSDKTMFTFDPSELPPAWRARSKEPIADNVLAGVRVMTLLKGYMFKTSALLRERIIDEVKQGNFRPLVPFLVLYPVMGELIADLGALFTANRKRYDDLMNDKESMESKLIYRFAGDMAHATGLTLIDTLLEAAFRQHNPTYAARDVYEFAIGPFLADAVHTTVQLPMELISAQDKKRGKTAGEKRYGALMRWTRSTFPATSPVINLAKEPTNGGTHKSGTDFHFTPMPTR